MDVETFVLKYKDRKFMIEDISDLEKLLKNGTPKTDISSDLLIINSAISHVIRSVSQPLRQYCDHSYQDPWIEHALNFFAHATEIFNQEISATDSENPRMKKLLENKGWILNSKGNLFSHIFYSVQTDRRVSLVKKLTVAHFAQKNKYGAGILHEQAGAIEVYTIYDIAGRLAKDAYFTSKLLDQKKTPDKEYFTQPNWGSRWIRSNKKLLNTTAQTDPVKTAFNTKKLGDAHFNVGNNYDPSSLSKAKMYYTEFLHIAENQSAPGLLAAVRTVSERIKTLG